MKTEKRKLWKNRWKDTSCFFWFWRKTDPENGFVSGQVICIYHSVQTTQSYEHCWLSSSCQTMSQTTFHANITQDKFNLVQKKTSPLATCVACERASLAISALTQLTCGKSNLPAKEAITVGSSLGFNFKFLHIWSHFDLPKLVPIKYNPFDARIMVVYHWYMSVSYLLRLSQYQEFGDNSGSRNKQKGLFKVAKHLQCMQGKKAFSIPLFWWMSYG